MKPIVLLLLVAILSSLTAPFVVADDGLNKPNILFCIADDASMKTFGAYGGTMVETPAVDRIAREGVLFRNAYNCNPKCSPARACLLTGRYSWQLEEACNHFPHFPAKFKTFPYLLKDAGYHTGFTGKGWGPGTYDGSDNPAGQAYNRLKQKPPYSGISGTSTTPATLGTSLTKRNKAVRFVFGWERLNHIVLTRKGRGKKPA